MQVVQAYRFALDPTSDQVQMLNSARWRRPVRLQPCACCGAGQLEPADCREDIRHRSRAFDARSGLVVLRIAQGMEPPET